jgi:hypothetical protein
MRARRYVSWLSRCARTQGKLAATSMIGFLAFVPLLLWTGVRDLTFVLALVALALASGVQLWTLTRRENRIKHGAIYANACINAVLIGLVCRMVGPFIIAPTLVTTTLMAYAAHPGLDSIRVTASILTAAVAVPWLLELAGVLSPTYRFTAGGELVLSSSVLHFSAVPVQLAFALLLVSLVAVVAVLVRGSRSARYRPRTRSSCRPGTCARSSRLARAADGLVRATAAVRVIGRAVGARGAAAGLSVVGAGTGPVSLLRSRASPGHRYCT